MGLVVVSLALGAAFGAAQQQSQQAADTSQAASVAERGTRGQVPIMREVFTYSQRGRRDPMVSLMSSPDIRPLITEIEVIAIVYTGSSATSMATLRHLIEPSLIYRVKVGDALGRMRIAGIEPREVVFTLDEFGFSRTERLPVKPDTTARTP
jgi:hypothetical protein